MVGRVCVGLGLLLLVLVAVSGSGVSEQFALATDCNGCTDRRKIIGNANDRHRSTGVFYVVGIDRR